MKLLPLSIFLLLAFTTLTYANEEMDDDEMEVEIDDDDADVEDDDEDIVIVGDDDDDDDDVPMEEDPQQEQPQFMQVPMEGIQSFIHFVDGSHTITGGKLSEIVIGVQNNGEKNVEMISAMGQMSYPAQANEVVQNFTNIGYEKQMIVSKNEASFYYAIMPNQYLGGREFNIMIQIIYKDALTNEYYNAIPYNETISILEAGEGVYTQIFFLYLIGLLFVGLFAYLIHTKFLSKYMPKSAPKKIERGTENEGVNMAWIPANVKKCN